MNFDSHPITFCDNSSNSIFVFFVIFVVMKNSPDYFFTGPRGRTILPYNSLRTWASPA